MINCHIPQRIGVFIGGEGRGDRIGICVGVLEWCPRAGSGMFTNTCLWILSSETQIYWLRTLINLTITRDSVFLTTVLHPRTPCSPSPYNHPPTTPPLQPLPLQNSPYNPPPTTPPFAPRSRLLSDNLYDRHLATNRWPTTWASSVLSLVTTLNTARHCHPLCEASRGWIGDRTPCITTAADQSTRVLMTPLWSTRADYNKRCLRRLSPYTGVGWRRKGPCLVDGRVRALSVHPMGAKMNVVCRPAKADVTSCVINDVSESRGPGVDNVIYVRCFQRLA